jgi:hypothetical protein
MAKKLTELGVERLKAKENAYTRVAEGNLSIKVYPTSTKVWLYCYTHQCSLLTFPSKSPISHHS